ncbi:4Fe-4S dicluster domain-containing protein, partial [bacterium]|nr:4Fe-4S dicluster domain-containing protein [bacterium]
MEPVIHSEIALKLPVPNILLTVQHMVQACIQCGTCSGSCPNAFAMDFTPRRMWQSILAGQEDIIFDSKTFELCSSCYYCALRCPRGLPLTEAMESLKQIAAKLGKNKKKKNTKFYKNFVDNIRKNGRVQETGMMANYFISLKSPMEPMRYAPLGIRLM